MRLANVTFAALLAGFVISASSERAEACGGTFCDTGPTAMPVDQSGENVLFVMDGTSVEAHVQIQYQGAADRFAWVVPMQEIPEVSVGSQLLFQSLLQATVPSYGYNQQFDVCQSNGTGGASAGGTGGISLGGSGGAAGSSGGGPNVVFTKTVGAFQVTVLQGGTAQEVADWLTTNNYQPAPNAPAILQDYVAKNYVFAAVKLTGGAGVDEIHPLVFKYPGNEPCVPLELTAVAATEDMGVRTFFLGDDRVVPLNYKSMELNPVRIDWQSFASNYTQVVSRGADTAIANGQAFVTEYAGSSASVQTFNVFNPSWDYSAFQGIAPELVVDKLNTMNLTSCFGSYCQFQHPLIQSLLHEFLPVPTGLTDDEFYSNLAGHVAEIDLTKWDAALFSQAFKDRIQDPGDHAAKLIAKWPYLTRLFTTISPSEMTLDPIFMPLPGLSTVSQSQQATRRTTCTGQSAMLLPDGHQVALSAGAWPVWDSQMPWLTKIEEYKSDGTVLTLVDNTDAIDEKLLAWNKSQGWPPKGDNGYAGTGALGNGTGGGSGGQSANDSTGVFGGGCACETRGGPSTGLGLLIALGLLGFSRRRRGA